MKIPIDMKEERKRVEKLFSTKHRKGDFANKTDFADWFLESLKKNESKCYYCETSINDIRKLIAGGFLKTRKTGHGERGPVLEIDKRDNKKGYSKLNCELACYYCNNDKSYTLDSKDYKEHFGSAREKYFKYLLKNIIEE